MSRWQLVRHTAAALAALAGLAARAHVEVAVGTAHGVRDIARVFGQVRRGDSDADILESWHD